MKNIKLLKYYNLSNLICENELILEKNLHMVIISLNLHYVNPQFLIIMVLIYFIHIYKNFCILNINFLK